MYLRCTTTRILAVKLFWEKNNVVHTWHPARPSRGQPEPSSQPPGTSSCSLSAPSQSPAALPEPLSADQYTEDNQVKRKETNWVLYGNHHSTTWEICKFSLGMLKKGGWGVSWWQVRGGEQAEHCSRTQKTPPPHQEEPHAGLTFALIRYTIYCIVYQQGVGLQVKTLLERWIVRYHSDLLFLSENYKIKVKFWVKHQKSGFL